MDVQELLGKVARQLSVGRAFGEAYEKGGTLVVPVAFVAGGGGGGEGTSGAPKNVSSSHEPLDPEEEGSTTESAGGSGGGFGGVVLPVGVYVVKDDSVRWIPAVNANLVVLLAFMVVRMFFRARRRSHRHH